MLKNLTYSPSFTDDGRKEDKEEDEGECEQVDEVLLALEVIPLLQLHLAQLLPELQKSCDKEDKGEAISVDHQKKNPKEEIYDLFPGSPNGPRESRKRIPGNYDPKKKGIISPDDEDKEQSACESVAHVKEIKS